MCRTEVRLDLALLLRRAEQRLVVVQERLAFMPRKDAVDRLVSLGPSDAAVALLAVDEDRAVPEVEGAEDPAEGVGLRDVLRQLADVEDLVDPRHLDHLVQRRREHSRRSGACQRCLTEGDDAPLRELGLVENVGFLAH